LYPARGVTDDYAYGMHGIFCYTFELATEFIPPPAAVQQIVSDNMEAALILLRRVHHSTLTGIVTDAATEEPIVAEIFITGIDDTGEFRHPYTSNEAFGRYYRMLLPGEYEVTFSAYGYVDSDPYTVIITDDGQTELNVELFLAGTGSLSGLVISYNDQDPIENASVSLLNTPLDPVFTDEEGLFSFDNVSYGTYLLQIRAEGYGTLTEEISIYDEENYFSFSLYTPYAHDSFEDLENWITTGHWGLSSYYSYSGEYSLADSPQGEYQANMSSYARYIPIIDLTTATNASVAFMAKYALEAGYDYCYLQIMIENNNWITIGTFNGISDWTHKEFSLNDYLGEEITLRFFFTSDQAIEDEGIYIDDFTLFITDPVSNISDDLSTLQQDTLFQNYPNPFNAETTISFAIIEEGQVTLDIYNIIGQRVRRLLQEELQPGLHSIIWDGKNDSKQEISSGIYFYRLQRNDSSVVKKMILLK
ncbi:MAG: carboxypeptidase regulatory-like domain-containing protein, partial [Candidatus Cloacimonetes bacterium]|nr:carboxypeptidase regulatory-like domain-containing protein [Candidatus Cloacimonadota bacterium]